MKTHRLQAAFARKRETDHIRTERTQAVNRYYVHWGKQTSKFENWTAPEYYENAEENLRKTKEKKDKEEKLNERRDKLRNLLEQEKLSLKEELDLLKNPKSRKLATNVMEQIDQNFKSEQNEKRRLELEAKLYGRWRHGIDDECLLYESKSNNQVLAKLNWLDKQIEGQVQREQEDKIAQEQNLRLQEEVRRTEQHHRERQEIREKEIKEIRALHERHLEELKERELEAEYLKSEADNLKSVLEHIKNAFVSLDLNKCSSVQDVPPISNNLSKVKMVLRKRSEVFREQLEFDINLLKQLSKIHSDKNSGLFQLTEKLNQQFQAEMFNITQVEGMYESEAKIVLKQCEETWNQLAYERRLEITNLLKILKSDLSNKLYENQMRQKILIEIRETHLSSIENSNQRLKLLIQEQEESPRPLIIETPRRTKDELKKPLQIMSDSFTNLNLDCLGGAETGNKAHSARSQHVAVDSTQGPKFGRKKVAWL